MMPTVLQAGTALGLFFNGGLVAHRPNCSKRGVAANIRLDAGFDLIPVGFRHVEAQADPA